MFFKQGLIVKWTEYGMVLTLSLSVSLLILASSTALPMPGWGYNTFWGEQLASILGFVLFGALALTSIVVALTSRRWILLFVTLPIIALSFARPEIVSTDEGVLNSFLVADAVLKESRLGRNQASVAQLLERIEAGENPDKLIALAVQRLEASRWFAPELYATRARIERWSEAGGPLSDTEIKGVFPDLTVLHNKLSEMEAEVRNRASLDAFCLRSGEPANDCNNPGPRQYTEADIDAQKAIVATADSAQTSAANRVLDNVAFFNAALERLKMWRASFVVTLAIAMSVIACAFVMKRAYRLPLFTSGFITIGILAQTIAFSGVKFDTAPGMFIAIHGIFMLALFLGARVIRMFVVQNVDIWALFTGRQLIELIVRSLKWWWPLAICIAVGVLLNVLATNRVDQSAYNIPLGGVVTGSPEGEGICLNQEKTLIFPAAINSHQLEADIDNSVGCYFMAVVRQINGADVAGQVADAAGSVKEIAANAFDRVVPTSLPCNKSDDDRPHCISDAFNYPSCGRLDIVCGVKYFPQRIAKNAYANERSNQRARFLLRVDEAVLDAKEGSVPAESAIVRELSAAVLDIELGVRNALAASFRYWDVINALGALFFVIAVVKSFGFVLARIIFDRMKSEGLSVVDHAESIGPDHASFGRTESETIDKPGLYYVRYDTELTSVVPTGPWLWRFWQLALARFPKQTFLWRFQYDKSETPVGFEGISSQNFVKIELASKGDAVAIDVKKLLAFSSTIKLKRVWSFHLSHLVQGRASMAVATGTGVLFLQSVGKITIRADNDDRHSPPSRLLAWAPNQNFLVSSKVDGESMYMGGVTIRGQRAALTLFDAKGARFGFSGALKFIPMLLLPF